MRYNIRQEAVYVYHVLRRDASHYTGLTDDLMRRFEEQVNGAYETNYNLMKAS